MHKMLPALPRAFGNLKEVFRSAEKSISGKPNELGLPSVKNSLVILVDGLGWFNLTEHSGHAPFLNRNLVKSSKGFCAFPSTTASSIMSLATGETPSKHGFFGYRVFNRRNGESINLLTGLDESSHVDYLLSPRISDTSKVTVVSRPEYSGSGFSWSTFGDSRFIAEREIEARFDLALDELNSGSGKLVYLYVPELDQAAHRYGCASKHWIQLLELVDSKVKWLVMNTLPHRGIILTADHGVIDVDSANHIYLDECPQLQSLLDVGGDPRASFIYFEQYDPLGSVQKEINNWLDGRAHTFTVQELVFAGLYTEDILSQAELLPDLFILAAGGWVSYHRKFAKPASLAMIGQHGGISEKEIAVPIIKLASYSSSLLVP